MVTFWQAVPMQPFFRGQAAATIQLSSQPQPTLNGPTQLVAEHARPGVLAQAAFQVRACPSATLHNNRLQLGWRRRLAIYTVAAATRGHRQRTAEGRLFGRQKPGTDSKASRLREQCMQDLHQFLTDWEGAMPSVGGCVVVLCGAHPGNVGNVLRSCAVLGVTTICVIGMGYLGREDVRKIVNVSQIDRKPHWQIKLVPVPSDENQDFFSRLRAAGFHFVGLAAELPMNPHQQQQQETQQSKSVMKASPLWEVDLTMSRLALVFGRDEDDGEAFPTTVGSQLDAAATVPMQIGTNDSLNLSSTVATAVYEWRRQLAAHPNCQPPGAPKEPMPLQPASARSEIPPDEPIPGEAPTERKVAVTPEAKASLPENLRALTVQELRKLAEERGLPSTGTKAAIVEVLKDSE